MPIFSQLLYQLIAPEFSENIIRDKHTDMKTTRKAALSSYFRTKVGATTIFFEDPDRPKTDIEEEAMKKASSFPYKMYKLLGNTVSSRRTKGSHKHKKMISSSRRKIKRNRRKHGKQEF